jgi:hypothetical protein
VHEVAVEVGGVGVGDDDVGRDPLAVREPHAAHPPAERSTSTTSVSNR